MSAYQESVPVQLNSVSPFGTRYYAILNSVRGFLLFAGALHVNLGDLIRQKLTITFLVTVGSALPAAETNVATQEKSAPK